MKLLTKLKKSTLPSSGQYVEPEGQCSTLLYDGWEDERPIHLEPTYVTKRPDGLWQSVSGGGTVFLYRWMPQEGYFLGGNIRQDAYGNIGKAVRRPV